MISHQFRGSGLVFRLYSNAIQKGRGVKELNKTIQFVDPDLRKNRPFNTLNPLRGGEESLFIFDTYQEIVRVHRDTLWVHLDRVME